MNSFDPCVTYCRQPLTSKSCIFVAFRYRPCQSCNRRCKIFSQRCLALFFSLTLAGFRCSHFLLPPRIMLLCLRPLATISASDVLWIAPIRAPAEIYPIQLLLAIHTCHNTLLGLLFLAAATTSDVLWSIPICAIPEV